MLTSQGWGRHLEVGFVEMVRKKEGRQHSLKMKTEPEQSTIKRSGSRSRSPHSSAERSADQSKRHRSRSGSSTSSMDSMYDSMYNPSHTSKVKSESAKKWTARKQRILCQLWEQEPTLYDPKQRNPEKKENIIARIAKEIEMDPTSVGKRMSSLRTVYGKIIQMPPTYVLSEREMDIKDFCGFLNPFMRCTKSSIKPEKDKSQSNVSVPDSNVDVADSQLEKNPNDMNGTYHEDIPNFPSIPILGPSAADLPKTSDFWKEYLHILRNAQKPDFDLHENWGRGLAEKLKSFDPLKAEEIKLHIDSIMLDHLKQLV